MTKSKFGTTSWDDYTGGKKGSQGDKKRSDFMRLSNGSNEMRIITQPHGYLNHKFKKEGDPGFGDNVKCSAPLHESCPLCDQGHKPKKRWYVGIVDRKSNTYKILDISVAVYDQLKTFNKSKWGDPQNYDIDIVKDEAADPASYYRVVPVPPTPLTPSDLELKAQASEETLDKFCTPPTPEWVLSRINTIREKKGLSPLVAAVPTPSNGVVKPAMVDMSNDEDISFPAVQ